MKFTIQGPPMGKARPRVTKWGTHNEEKTILYENLVKLSYEQAEGGYSEKPLEVSIWAYHDIPKSTSQKKRALALLLKLLPCKKPDVDNIAKIILDSLNKIAYKDDTQVCALHVYKLCAEQAHVDIQIEEIPEVEAL